MPDREITRALSLFLILHADHEQNCSTSTVRMVASSGANMFASCAAGVCALWGPLHGGANVAVVEMLEFINQSGMKVSDYVAKVKAKDSKLRLMGFGHRVYENFDPRSKILQAAADKVLAKLHVQDPCWRLPASWKTWRCTIRTSWSASCTRMWISTAASSCAPWVFH